MNLIIEVILNHTEVRHQTKILRPNNLKHGIALCSNARFWSRDKNEKKHHESQRVVWVYFYSMDWEALTGVKMDKVSIWDDFFFNFPHVFCLQRLAKVFVIRIIKIRMPVVEL